MPTLASDAERDRCARSLRDHAAAGRLEVPELEQRLALAYGARYRSQLRLALRDLPRGHGPRLARAADRVDRFMLKLHAWSYATVNGSLVGVWALAGQGDFWPGAERRPVGRRPRLARRRLVERAADAAPRPGAAPADRLAA